MPTSTAATAAAIAVPKEQSSQKTVSKKTGVSHELLKSLKQENDDMLLFALHNGKVINPELNPLMASDDFNDLINAHNILVKDLAPATPKSILYLRSLYERDKKKSFFNKLPLIRNLIILALLFLIGFVVTSLSPEVNDSSLREGILENQGYSLLFNMIFLCSVSGLGVVFYLLKHVSKAIQNGTLVSEDTYYYTALIVLGIISGLILSEIVSLYNDRHSFSIFNNCILALIGGFSSEAIFSILQSIIDKIKAVFTSSTPMTNP